jgi:hypothetical protein
MIYGDYLGTPDEGMKEEGGKVESWSGSLARGVWYGWIIVGVVRSYAAASASASEARAIHLLYWGQALVAGSSPRLFLLFDRHLGARRYRCYNNKQVTVIEVSVVVWMSWINNQTSHSSLLMNVYGEVPVL